MNEQRKVILESDRAGQAITAPQGDTPSVIGNMQWVQRDGYFALQQYRECEEDLDYCPKKTWREWVDVCVIKEEKP
jgi:hypothetical protein